MLTWLGNLMTRWFGEGWADRTFLGLEGVDWLMVVLLFVVLEGGLTLYATIADFVLYPSRRADEDDYADEAY